MAISITLDSSSPEISYLCSKDKRLAKVISDVGPLVYTKKDDTDSYAFLVHEVIEQMLSIKAGQRIYSRLSELCDGDVCPHSISKLSIQSLRGIGTSEAKAKCIKSLTEHILAGELDIVGLQNETDIDVMKKLTAIRGIGPWTAKMYLLFVLERPDILPYEDGAFLQSYRWMYKTDDCSPKTVIKRCAKWKPYSSIASRYLYRALDMGLTKEEFHLFKKEVN